MHKGPFAPTQKFENGVKFEADDEVDAESLKETKKEKKNKKDKKHGKKGGRKGNKKQNDKKQKTRWDVTTSLLFGNNKSLQSYKNCSDRKTIRINLEKKVICLILVDAKKNVAWIVNLNFAFRVCRRYIENWSAFWQNCK